MDFRPDHEAGRFAGEKTPNSKLARHRRGRAHYAQEFDVYTQARTEGRPAAKRARCQHCDGDWAYNETRLKTHIVDPVRGCQQVPAEVRERVRRESGDFRRDESRATDTHGRNHCVTKGNKVCDGKERKEADVDEESARDGSGRIAANSLLKDTSAEAGETRLAAKQKPEHSVHIGIEFSRESGTHSRALWIATELLQGQFSAWISRLSLIPVSSSEQVFCLRIDGKPLWSRVPEQPALDYEALRPILTAYFSG